MKTVKIRETGTIWVEMGVNQLKSVVLIGR